MINVSDQSDFLSPVLDNEQLLANNYRKRKLGFDQKSIHPADVAKAIATAHIGHGYSQQSIATHLGLHYATVSRIIKNERDTSKHKT